MKKKLETYGIVLIITLIVIILLDISYKGLVLRSIHQNTSRSNMNFDGEQAQIFGFITLVSAIYLLYLVIGILRNKQ